MPKLGLQIRLYQYFRLRLDEMLDQTLILLSNRYYGEYLWNLSSFLPPLFGPLSPPSMPKPNVPFSPHAQASDILIPAQLQTVSIPRWSAPLTHRYFNCIKKTDVYNGIAPDYYTGKKLRTDGTIYTVGSGELSTYRCAWALFRSQNTNTNGIASEWKINTAIVGHQRGLVNKWADYNSAIFWVVSGDQISLKGYGDDYLYIYPCRGN